MSNEKSWLVKKICKFKMAAAKWRISYFMNIGKKDLTSRLTHLYLKQRYSDLQKTILIKKNYFIYFKKYINYLATNIWSLSNMYKTS